MRKQRKKLLGENRLPDILRISEKSCLGSLGCFWRQLLAPQQRPAAAAQAAEPAARAQDEAEHQRTPSAASTADRTAGAAEV